MNEQDLLVKLKSMDLSKACGETQTLSMTEILMKISETKQREKLRKELARNTTSPTLRGGSRPSSPGRARSRSPGRNKMKTNKSLASLKTSSHLKQDHSIARFRDPGFKWDQTLQTDRNLLKSLYRIPNRDPSGQIIRSLCREETKGLTVWKPPEVDRTIPPVEPDKCTHSFKELVSKHVQRAAAVVDAEYAELPARTERERNIRARAGADLFELQQARDKLLTSLSRSGTLTSLGGTGGLLPSLRRSQSPPKPSDSPGKRAQTR